ncbi:hypothetical protein GC167_05965 [bacterium]|nr:hypothetical protein [bacterium]
MRGIGAATASALGVGGLIGSTPHHLRRGRKSNRHPSGGKPAMLNTRADGERAIRRAKRWLRNQSTGPEHIPPRHIFKNAELAAFQFGDDITN